MAPAYSVMAERENEELVGKDPVRPEEIFARPWPIRSWSSFHSVPALALSTLALEAVYRKLTSVMRKAGSSNWPNPTPGTSCGR